MGVQNRQVGKYDVLRCVRNRSLRGKAVYAASRRPLLTADPFGERPMSDAYVRDWFAIDYTEGAGEGMPPIFEASAVFTYSDNDDTWVAAVLNPPPTSRSVARCILRLRSRDVAIVTRHDSLLAAIDAREGRQAARNAHETDGTDD